MGVAAGDQAGSDRVRRGLSVVDDLAFTAPLWCDSGGSWRFVTVPDDLSDVIRFESGPPTGFGAVKVEVSVGATTWRT
ncbi:DUF1905 domain-containing protein, partial [Sedimentibacter sp. B4]|uniref:DUF1905 domain-containing protein n=1 Tax=Sedimentibacter sp. B4 TaxID=304766 RepID=UPI000590D950